MTQLSRTAVTPQLASSLAAQAQTVLGQDPFSGRVFCFRGRRGDLVKLLCLFAKHAGPPGPATPTDQLGPISQA